MDCFWSRCFLLKNLRSNWYFCFFYQDGYFQLSKVDVKIVSWSVVEDIEIFIKMGKGNEFLLYDFFVVFM